MPDRRRQRPGGCHAGPKTHSQARQEAEQRWKLARADVKARLAAAEFDAGRLDKAARELESARELDPQNPTLQLLDAQVHLNEGRPMEAERLADSLIGDPQVGGQAHYLKGVILQQRGDWEAAARSYATAVRLMPLDAAALVAAVGACLQCDDEAGAASLIESSRAALSNESGFHAAAAELAERRGDWREATRCWRRVADLSIEPDSLERLASAAYRAEHWAEALSALQALVEARPAARSAALHYRLALCRQKLRDEDGAREELAAALTIEPGHPAALRLLVELLVEAGELVAARTLLDGALAEPGGADADLLQAAAILTVQAGDSERARPLIEEMLRASDSQTRVLARRLQERVEPTARP
jgi:tetratricopeptide (TPR) repeat protein